MKHVALLLLTYLVLRGTVAAQEGRPGAGADERRAHVERYMKGLDPERRALFERRLSKLRELSPDERRELLRRAKALHEVETHLRSDVPDDLDERMRRAGPRKAGALWRDHFEGEVRKRGRHRGERLSPFLRRKLAEASPEERMRLLSRHFAEKERMVHAALPRLVHELGLRPGEARRILQLPRPQRFAEILKLRRRLIERRFERDGLPPEIRAEDWEAMRELRDDAFFRRMRDLGVSPRALPRAPFAPGPGARRLRDR